MAKRPATETLEVILDSPASKKARYQDDIPPPPPPQALPSNDTPPPPPPPSTVVRNGGPALSTHATKSQQNGQSRSVRSDPEEDGEDGDEDEDEDDVDREAIERRRQDLSSSNLYLDTIARERLDFDFEKLCSVTLSNVNVYACLVCGKYYSGRGPKTQAYFHSLDEDHHVYINLETQKVYVLPESYEVKSRNLDDIKVVADPRYTSEEVKALDREPPKAAWDLQGRKYVPGYVGMNNIKANDYLNVVVHILAHVPPLRNFLMLEDLSSKPELVKRFSIIVRKIWNAQNFKSHVSPHELMQEITMRSNKKYHMNEQADPAEFLNWVLNNLHLAMGGSKTKARSSLIQKIFQGTLRVESQAITARADVGNRLKFEDADIKSSTNPFMILTLDLPPAPLFQNDAKKDIIPQVPLSQVLQKYNGLTAQERMNTRMRYRLLHPLPPYLTMHIKRFQPNKFLQSQRNPTIVTFNTRTLDMSPYVEPDPKLYPMSDPIIYDLIACVTYEGVKVRDDSVEGEAERKVWKVQVKEGGERQEWWEIQDLFVESISGELLATKETYLMIWEKRKGKGKAKTS